MELQSTQIFIKKECREIHGVCGALELAFSKIKETYLKNMKAEINKDSTFIVRLLIEMKDG